MNLRDLPAVTAVLERPIVRELVMTHGRAVVVHAVRAVIAAAREGVRAGGAAVVDDADVVTRAAEIARGTLVPVLNATGVIVHTNLGRAPLAAEAIAEVARIAAGYATLEYDLDEGARGERHGHARDLLRELTGAEDALVVNNNAAAVLLMLAALAVPREVVVSRGELVEIGGGFRVPDVLAQSGARLVEVGTTNRTHLRDYAQAIRPETAMLLKVHRSNFTLAGFTAEASVASLASLARERGLVLAYDAGSGCLGDAIPDEPSVARLLADGADVVTFSGDKLLGGPQAGIVVGRQRLLDPMRRHPLMRALRPDKLCLAALVATLRLWRDRPAGVPVAALAAIPAAALAARARAIAARHPDLEAVATTARIGGGAAPAHAIPSWGLRATVGDPEALASRLRAAAIVARIEDGAVILDLRCIPDAEDVPLGVAVSAAIADA